MLCGKMGAGKSTKSTELAKERNSQLKWLREVLNDDQTVSQISCPKYTKIGLKRSDGFSREHRRTEGMA